MKPMLVAAVVFAALSTSGFAAPTEPAVEDARAFVERAESDLAAVWEDEARAGWVQATYITDDTEILAAKASAKATELSVSLAHEAGKFEGLALPEDLSRKLLLLKLALTVPAPDDPEKTKELSRIETEMEGAYGKGKYCPDPPDGKDCWDLPKMEQIFAESRDPKVLLDLWKGWRETMAPLKKDYQRYVQLGDEGAKELGFADLGAMWRSKYDMPPDDFARELDRLWEQMKPLYVSLHAYVRRRLVETYGKDLVPPDGPIPAHLLGNMWAQQWNNIYPLVAPENADPGYDLTERLKLKRYDALRMVHTGENFFRSLGLAPLPQSFWERSLFTQPRDRDVVCHASAWSIDGKDDVRLKMCIHVDAEDFATVHHELGHSFYQLAYSDLSPLFRDSANDGFHEAIGDTIALSVTPAYLKTIGLIDQMPDPSKDIGLLLQMALDKVAFLPFGLLVDQWRWKVFSGEITPDHYNQAWWGLRKKYQGVAPPVPRSEKDFDPIAKYHVASSTPYARYFLASVLQFQFHRALCEIAGYQGPLNRCTIYDNKEAGKKLDRMLQMGTSEPWPEALFALTGKREMDATAILDYFAPLQKWLDEQNAGHPVGW